MLWYDTPFETGDRWSKQYTLVIPVQYDPNVIVEDRFTIKSICHTRKLEKL